MLGCPCKMIKPFTFATTKKSSALRYSSFTRKPLVLNYTVSNKNVRLTGAEMMTGYYCYNAKKMVSLHAVKSRYFTRSVWDSPNGCFKEQKNFIWTSIRFWKAPEDKSTGNSEETSKAQLLEKKGASFQNVTPDNNKNVINIVGDKPEWKSEIPISKEDKSESELKNLVGETDGKMESKTKSPDSENFEKYITENIVLTENKKKVPDITVSGIDTKVLVKPAKKDLPKISEPNNTKPGGKTTCNGEVKRQMYEVNLGEHGTDKKLLDPPNDYTEPRRAADEIKMIKDSPQKFFEKAKNILLKTSTADKSEEADRNAKEIDLGEPKGNLNVNMTTRRRQTVDLNRSSTERNFITPVRAMTDFLLKPSDLEGLRKTKRRSPYENDPPITVYWRKDVEAKAIDIWGSKENLLKEILKRDIERRRYQQNLFTVKRRLRDYRREQGRESEVKLEKNGLWGSSGKVVLTAIVINGANFLFKLFAWLFTGSHSMFSETIHSLADTINQLILAYGIHKSVQRADSDHPYGYTNMRYVASLISGVGIFCVGSGLSFYHGVVGLTNPSDPESFYWAYIILLASLGSEGATLLVAFNSIRHGAKKSEMTLSEYVYRGQDPSVNVVLLEDTAAVVGVGCAGVCMGLSSYYNSHIPDAIGSFLVGGLLASVASFIIYTNVAALVGRSISQERLDKINAVLESDVMIRAIHDVKGIDIGNSLVRYKAEMDFDGGELTRSYLDKQDLNQMLEEVRKMQTIDELEEFMLKHGENIVDMMGGEIDRIELKLRKKHPEIRHCDLEIL